MKYTLVYDVATMSRTPWRALIFAIGFGVLAIGAWVWNSAHGEPSGVFVLMGVIGAVLFTLVAAGTEYEKRLIARKQPLHVEGPIHSIWHDRTRRSGKSNDYNLWEGFSIGPVAFAYVQNTDMNYFNNAGDKCIELANGLLLRVHYLEKHKNDRPIRYIVRVERLELT